MAEFGWCPECERYHAHSPGADQCVVCESKEMKKKAEMAEKEAQAAQAGKDVTK